MLHSMPVSMGNAVTSAALAITSRISDPPWRRMRTILCKRKILIAIAIRTPARAAWGHIAEQLPAEEHQHHDAAACDQRRKLRTPSSFDDSRRAWRAGVDREGTEEAGEKGAHPDAREIRADRREVPALFRKGSHDRCRLHHADQRDDPRQRRQSHDVMRSGERGQAGVRHARRQCGASRRRRFADPRRWQSPRPPRLR